MQYIRHLHESGASDVALVGGKAASLGRLSAAGFAVPSGFCVTLQGYREVAAQLRLEERLPRLRALLEAGAPEEELECELGMLRDSMEQAALPEALWQELSQAFGALPVGPEGVAVRSSATSEDSAGASSAGQYVSVLSVRGLDALQTSLKRCWASLWLGRAVRYRWRQGLPLESAAMGVLVQRMVDADAAGVVFTKDPGAADRNQLVIESGEGCGEALVSGLVTPDRFEVRRADCAVRQTQVSPSGKPSLTSDQARTLAKLALDIEAHFQAPQDIEWALKDGELAILQARPITAALPAREVSWESPIPGAKWARISLCDSWLPSPLSPLFASTLFPALIRGWTERWAGDEARQAANPLIPKPMHGTINGYAYLRIDFPMSRHPLLTLRLVIDGVRAYFGGLEARWRNDIQPRYVARLAELSQVDLGERSHRDILALLDEAQRLSGEYWGVIGGLAWYWNAGEWALSRLHPKGGVAYAPLLQGYMTKTVEAELALYALAQAAGASKEGGPQQSLGTLGDFLGKYGHQVYNLDFVEPTPAESPAAILSNFEAYQDGSLGDPRERLRSLEQGREACAAEAMARLNWAPVRRRLFEAAWRWARHYAQVRDEALFDFTRGWPLMRAAYLELGRRLVARGLLREAEDVFFLTGSELEDVLEGGASTTSWAGQVAERRSLWTAQKRLLPPRRVPDDARMTFGGLDITGIALFQKDEGERGEAKLRGSAVSPGRVTATARTISSPEDFGKLKAGDILIAPYITPAWTSLLSIAGGVVTDTGGLLSHGSIVAREYGIPAVMGTQVATRVIQDGGVVTVDGDRGWVYAPP